MYAYVYIHFKEFGFWLVYAVPGVVIVGMWWDQERQSLLLC